MDSTYLSVADTAKLMRKALKQAFPDLKCSVQSNNYAGGGSIRVEYNDDNYGVDAVREVAEKFQACDFDGQDDSTHWREPTMVDGKLFRFGSHYVFVTNIATLYDEEPPAWVNS
jgi:hypothetical protein